MEEKSFGTEWDQERARQLQDALPVDVMDAHAHLFRFEDLGGAPSDLVDGAAAFGIAQWRESVGWQVGRERLRGGLFMPFPVSGGDVDRANRYLLDQLVGEPRTRGLMLITPEMAPETAEEFIFFDQIVGFKPYHCFANIEGKTFQVIPSQFIPEWAWELAEIHHLIIVLHLVRDQALADPENQRYLKEHCEAHPSARLILAHAGRGFQPQHTIQGLAPLVDFDNVWFDASGICEPRALVAILDQFGPRRLLWGSDYPISERPGKCVAVGDSFSWIAPQTVDGPGSEPIHGSLVGLENLQAVLDAIDDYGLNADDCQDIFAANLTRLLFPEPAETEGRGQRLYLRAKQIFPGGTQLLSKRPEMFAPDQWPAYFREARGCEVWDMDGQRYYDFSINGVGTCLLGYRDPDVTRAVRRRLNLGSMSTLNSPEEVALAEQLCAIHPWAEQVRLARTGGEVAAVAVRIARATTNRSVVAICGYHGWSDWYLAANLGENEALRGHLLPGLEPLGVPRELQGTVEPFRFNDRAAVDDIIDRVGDRLAAVVMEPCRSVDPDPGFLEYVRDRAHQAGALLIFDEITIGWRRIFGGAHLLLGVEPDMAVFAKCLGSGHPIAAVIGSAAAMSGAHESFISSSYWTEGIGPAAALATLEKMEKVRAWEQVNQTGTLLQSLLREAAADTGLPVKIGGYPCMPSLNFDHEQGAALKTLYTQCMLEHGFLAGSTIFLTTAHTEEFIRGFGEIVQHVFDYLARSLEADAVTERLRGPVAHSGFQRLLS